MPLSYAFGACPSQSSLQLRLGLPRGRPRRPTAPERAIGACSTSWQARMPNTLPEHAFISLFRSSLRPRKRVLCSPRRHRLIACFLRLRGIHRSLRLLGPYDAFRSTLTRPSRATLRLLADRPGLPPPALPVSRICQPCFMLGRPWAPSLQRLLPARRRRTLSGPTVLHAVFHLAVPRLRGFQRRVPPPPCGVDVARRAPPSPCGSDVTRSRGCVPYVDVVHAVAGPLLSWSFPPFEDDLPVSSHTSAGLLSWAFVVRGSPSTPLARTLEPARTCALQSVREPEV